MSRLMGGPGYVWAGVAIVVGVAVGMVAPGVSDLGQTVKSSITDTSSAAAIGVMTGPSAEPTPEPTPEPTAAPRQPARTVQRAPTPTPHIVFTTPHETPCDEDDPHGGCYEPPEDEEPHEEEEEGH